MGITVHPLARSESESESIKSVVRSSRSCGYLTITATTITFSGACGACVYPGAAIGCCVCETMEFAHFITNTIYRTIKLIRRLLISLLVT